MNISNFVLAFIEQTPKHIALIRRGVIEGDFEMASSLSQKLGYTSSVIGAKKLTSIFNELENQFNDLTGENALPLLETAETEFENVKAELFQLIGKDQLH